MTIYTAILIPRPPWRASFARWCHAHHLIRLISVPLPSAPRGSPLFRCAPEPSQPLNATGLSRLWNSCFFLRSHRLPCDLTLLRRSEAGLTFKCLQYARLPLTPDGDRRLQTAFYFSPGRRRRSSARRLLRPCDLSNLFYLFASARQTSLRSDCPGRPLSQPSP